METGLSGTQITIAIAVVGNLVATIGVGIRMLNKIEEAAQWRGWADTQIKVNENRLNSHGDRIGTLEKDFARHDGQNGAMGNG